MSQTNLSDKAGEHTLGQLLYVRYFVAVLVDLVVLNLFEEYWGAVIIDSFTISLLTAIILQVTLKFTIKIEHKINHFFKSRFSGTFMKITSGVVMYLVLLAAKISILELINWAFGDRVEFSGPWHRVIAFLTVVIVMLTIEGVVVRLYFKLEKSKSEKELKN